MPGPGRGGGPWDGRVAALAPWAAGSQVCSAGGPWLRGKSLMCRRTCHLGSGPVAPGRSTVMASSGSALALWQGDSTESCRGLW